MTFGGHFDVELLINAMRILYKMYNKFSFYSIVVQTVAPEGSSATEGLNIFFFAPQRNIFHRCFELHLLHLDDERDLHRAAPRDVTLENMSS